MEKVGQENDEEDEGKDREDEIDKQLNVNVV